MPIFLISPKISESARLGLAVQAGGRYGSGLRIAVGVPDELRGVGLVRCPAGCGWWGEPRPACPVCPSAPVYDDAGTDIATPKPVALEEEIPAGGVLLAGDGDRPTARRREERAALRARLAALELEEG